jgi:hypothetical protein
MAGNATFMMESSETTKAPPAAIQRIIPAYDGTASRSPVSMILIDTTRAGSLVAGVAAVGAILLPAAVIEALLVIMGLQFLFVSR